jgi:hypothetical protein
MVRPKSFTIRRSEELARIYSTLNNELFCNALPDVLLSLAFKVRGATQYIQKAHTDKATTQVFGEILIEQELINRGLVDLCKALTREMIHLYQLQCGLDKPNRRTHNKEWVSIAHNLGFETDKPYGNTIKLTPTLEGRFMKAVATIKQMNLPLPSNATQYAPGSDGSEPPKDRNLAVWLCPCGKSKIRGSNETSVKCCHCNRKLTKQQS